MEFRYDNPTRIVFGRPQPPERAFLVTTRSVKASLDPSLVRAMLGVATIGQHAPIEEVRAAAAQAKKSSPDALLSIGGGSAIDAAKIVAWMLATGKDPLDKLQLEPVTLPHFAVPTTLSAAELDGAAGFSAGGDKLGIFARSLIPAVVFYDAVLALKTPLPLWLSTGIRALDHAIEGFLAPEANPLSEAASLEAIRRLPPALTSTFDRPDDVEARGEAQIGAWLSMVLPISSARGLSHVMGKQLGARFAIPHGVCSCLLLPHVMRDHQRHQPERMARIAEALGCPPGEAADAVADLIARLRLPRLLRDFALGEEDLSRAAEPLARRFARPIEELVALYRAAW
jgi:alcohol dehydrogenase class IV